MSTPSTLLTAADLGTLTSPPADARIPYGSDPLQFGDLRLPDGPGPHPVAILLHGGCWLAEHDLRYFGALGTALMKRGFATWNVEYRRIGNAGGGWPGTFLDVARGADAVRTLSVDYGLDAGRVIAIGHSAGGHLALWLAARRQLAPSSEVYVEDPIQLTGVLALAPAAHLARLHAEGTCEAAVGRLMGGSPAMHPDRYHDGSPVERLPLRVPQIVLVGRHDATWRPIGEAYHDLATRAGDQVALRVAPASGHFEMVVPSSTTWPLIEAAARDLVGP